MSSLNDIAELQDLLTDLPRFEQKLAIFAAKLNLNLAQFNADHISLRCHQTETAQRWRNGLQQCGNLMSETQINGRPIILFDLAQSLAIGPWQIDCIELPYPGKTYYPHEGWEHVELVLPGDPQTLYTRALALLPTTLPEGIKTKFSSPQGEHERLANPTLAVSDGEITIKFHPYTLRQIVDSERND
ncbi:VOC family protein [Yersinia vastinensis]|uniref:VOC family protein n=1 Tax=Yersinia vastinensis TaxID=2890318 RepID=UPI0005DAE5C9|nr:VOC family protein [Yersinia vastinensis]OVZ96329.1 VOC family protein [Yersinia frederiksenii]CNH96674.1 protein yecM [Yersinia frederiksenii]CNL21106.1 protein yecM [Yersinia frederiksenii]